MAATKTKPRLKPRSQARKTRVRKPVRTPELPDVLTLKEAAAFLRSSESDVERLATTQEIPARRIGDEWRFLKAALEDWLRRPIVRSNKEALLALAGAWKDDPTVEPMLEEIYRQRGRPMVGDK